MEENTKGYSQQVAEYDGSLDSFSFFVSPQRNLKEIEEDCQNMTKYGLNLEEALEAYYEMEENDPYQTKENIRGKDKLQAEKKKKNAV